MSERLARLAALHGVERGYEDVFKRRQDTPDSAIRAVLAAMGVDAADDAAIDASIAEL